MESFNASVPNINLEPLLKLLQWFFLNLQLPLTKTKAKKMVYEVKFVSNYSTDFFYYSLHEDFIQCLPPPICLENHQRKLLCLFTNFVFISKIQDVGCNHKYTYLGVMPTEFSGLESKHE